MYYRHSIIAVFFSLLLAACAQAKESPDPVNNEEPKRYIDATSDPLTTPWEEIITCPMGTQGEQTLRLWRRLNYWENSYLYYFQENEEERVGIREYYEDLPDWVKLRDRENNNATPYVEASCLPVPGSKEHIVVVTFAPNAGRMMAVQVLRYNSFFEQWQNQSISTEKRPSHVYVNKKEMLLVAFRPEQDRKNPRNTYTVSRYLPEGAPEEDDMPWVESEHSKLPSRKGFAVIPVKVQLEMRELDPPVRPDTKI